MGDKMERAKQMGGTALIKLPHQQVLKKKYAKKMRKKSIIN
jgi:hypothetical protein